MFDRAEDLAHEFEYGREVRVGGSGKNRSKTEIVSLFLFWKTHAITREIYSIGKVIYNIVTCKKTIVTMFAWLQQGLNISEYQRSSNVELFVQLTNQAL